MEHASNVQSVAVSVLLPDRNVRKTVSYCYNLYFSFNHALNAGIIVTDFTLFYRMPPVSLQLFGCKPK